MNSSPGGISGIFVHKKFFESELPNLIGWWSNKAETRFEMRFQLDKEKGAAAFCVSNPPQLLLAVNYANESDVPIMQASDFEQDEFPMRFPLQNAQRSQRESDFLPLRPLNER